MCGLFGLLRSAHAENPGRASDVFVTLGTLAEERGRDSAGIALFTGHPAQHGAGLAPVGDVDDRRSDLLHAGCRVVKGRGPFSGVWRPDLLETLDEAPVALGHTRWATQGSPRELTNASPLLVPGLSREPGVPAPPGIVATHNGDVEAGLLRALHDLPPGTGTTDSEPLFQLLAGRRTSPEISGALSTLVGRAALAWVDRSRPDRVHLARAALSPLYVAVDTEHNLYWASNPRWYREAERYTRVGFATVVMLREGTYLHTGLVRGRPQVLASATFRPLARPIDLDERVWTGFTPGDKARDHAELRHRVITGNGTGPLPIAV
jgi:glucosamine 6-phosphate synthetase-like amidotransferase/phosphosugar isomerase protein